MKNRNSFLTIREIFETTVSFIIIIIIIIYLALETETSKIEITKHRFDHAAAKIG